MDQTRMDSCFESNLKEKYMRWIAKQCVEVPPLAGFGNLTGPYLLAIIY